MPSKLMKKYNILFTICRDRMDQGKRRAKSDNVGKENPGYIRHSYLGLITTVLQ